MKTVTYQEYIGNSSLLRAGSVFSFWSRDSALIVTSIKKNSHLIFRNISTGVKGKIKIKPEPRLMGDVHPPVLVLSEKDIKVDLMSRAQVQIAYVKDKDIQARFLEAGDLFSLSDGGAPRIVTSTSKGVLYSRSIVTGNLKSLQRTSLIVCKLKTQR